MPQPYNGAVLTNGGINLLNRAQAGEVMIEFTRLSVGNGTYIDSEKTLYALQGMTELKNTRNTYPISSVRIHSEQSVEITTVITNQNLITQEALITEGYYIEEIGLYAKPKGEGSEQEVLYSIAVATGEHGDYIPAYNGYSPTRIVQGYMATVNNAAEVIISTEIKGIVLVEDFEQLKEQVEQHENDKQNPHGVTAAQVGLGNVDNTSDMNKPVSNATQGALDTYYQQATGYTDKSIADLIGGAPELRDTLKELSDAIDNNKDIADALSEAIGKKANQEEMESLLGTKLDKAGDSKDNTITFSSSDSTTPSGWSDVEVLKSGEKHSSILSKISTMFKNVRWLAKMLGTTDISKLSKDGTVTGALSELYTDKISKTSINRQSITLTGTGSDYINISVSNINTSDTVVGNVIKDSGNVVLIGITTYNGLLSFRFNTVIPNGTKIEVSISIIKSI